MNYKNSGVDIKEGDGFSDFMYRCAKETWKSNDKLRKLVVPYDDFSGIRYIDISNLPKDSVMNMNFDGIGTKVEIAELLGSYRTLAFDLFAMVCDDAAAIGAEPMLVGTILDIDRITDGKKLGYTTDIGHGYIEAAIEADVVIVNGEIAELGNRIKGRSNYLNINWGGSCLWVAKKDRLLDRSKIVEGDYLVGLQEYGFRSNGYSLIRKILNRNFKDIWKNVSLYNALLYPSEIYSRAIVQMTGGFYKKPKAEIHGIAHITGGGLYGKIKRMLKPSGLGVEINDPYEPTNTMTYLQNIGRVNDKEAYRTWNMGQGMVITTPEPDKVINIAKINGHNAKIIGRVIEENTIFIKNCGRFAKTDFLEFRDA